MSQNCNCEIPSRDVPVIGLKLTLPESIFSNPGSTGPGLKTWESEWFNIVASGAYDFAHNLSLAEPWKCIPRVIARVKAAAGGWAAGEILFCDGCNYIGTISDTDLGWAISVAAQSARVSFGNYKSYMGIPRAGGTYGSTMLKSNVECKLLISY